MKVQLGLVMALALIGGGLGWRATRRRRRSFYDESPLGMSEEAFRRRQRQRLFYRRTAGAVLGSLAGAAIGWALGVAFHLS
jgi:hypothetical protein